MRVHVFSDLHLEFGPIEFPEAVRSGALAEFVLLPGDIDVKRRGVAWAATTFSQRVCVIGGNHEVYGDSLYANIAASRAAAEEASRRRSQPLCFLEREAWTFKAEDGVPVRVIAATLWTDFQLLGPSKRKDAMREASRQMHDYERIRIRDQASGETRRLQPPDLLRINTESRTFLESALTEPFDGVTIVMTHHAPSLMSLPSDSRGDLLAASYASDERALIERYQPTLWVHGHVHESSDYTIGRTRVVCNPRGYFPDELNPSFDAQLVIELR